MCCFDPGDQGGTYNGNPLVTAVGCAVLDAIAAPGFLASVTAAGHELQRRLQTLSAKHGGGAVRGRGLLLALELAADVGPALVAETLCRGLLLNAPRPNLLRFMPALNVMPDEIAEMIEILDGALSAVASSP